MKHRSLRSVAFVLLTLQLALGFQWQAVQAVAPPMAMQMQSPMYVTAAATHNASGVATSHSAASDDDGASRVAAAAIVPDNAAHAVDASSAGQPGCPEHSMPRDCCHASACQCHCVYTPGVIDLPLLSNIATSVAVPSLASAQFVAPHIDEFLRPPIA